MKKSNQIKCSISGCDHISRSEYGHKLHGMTHTPEGRAELTKRALKGAKVRAKNKAKLVNEYHVASGNGSESELPLQSDSIRITPARKQYRRKEQVIQLPTEERSVQWCPCCGVDLRKVNVAINFQ